MIQNITKKSSKINPKSMEIEAWTGLGGSWGRLGSHLGSQGLPKSPRDQSKPQFSPIFWWIWLDYVMIFRVMWATFC